MKNLLITKSRQNGVVLIVALIFLVALTAVAAALMQNSTTDMKMSGATELREEAIQAAISAVDEVIFNQVAPGQNNLFALPLSGNFPQNNQANLLPVNNVQATATVTAVNNPLLGKTDCPNSRNASSVHKCNILQVTIVRPYGRLNNSTVTVQAGIVQKLL